MKRILALTLLFFTTFAHAEWTKVNVVDNDKYGISTQYIDIDSLNRLNNNIFTIWILYSNSKSYEVIDAKTLKTIGYSSSTKSLIKFDCKNQTAVPVTGFSYSGQMMKGSIVERLEFTKEEQNENWRPIEPNTVHMKVWKKFCS
jgi:hypothetical protein